MTRRARAGWLLLALLGTLAAGVTDDPFADRQWHIAHVRAHEAWSVTQGEDVVVAVVDTGVERSHPDLEGQVLEGVDLVDRGTPPDDPNGHGTLVAGVVAAIANNGVGVAGVAPETRILPVRVLRADGSGSSRTVAEGIRWAARNGAHVVNLSLAETPGQTRGLGALITTDVELAIREAALAGVVVVAASGNEGQEATPYAAGLPMLVVGATDPDDLVWPHSNRDDRTLFAPGVEIASTYREAGYALADGTSFAAPVVSAAAALVRATGLAADEARDALVSTAVDIGAGHGRVDVAAAVGVPVDDAAAPEQGGTAQPDPATQQPPAPPAPAASPAPPASPAQPPPRQEPPPPPAPPTPLEEPTPLTAGPPVLDEGPAPAADEPPPDVALVGERDNAAQVRAEPSAADEPVQDAGAGSGRGWQALVAAALLTANVVALTAVVMRKP